MIAAPCAQQYRMPHSVAADCQRHRERGTVMTNSPPPPAASPGAPLTAEQDRLWASYAHLGGILWFLPSLIIWLVYKDRGPLTAQEAREALNWQITWMVAWVASQILAIVTGPFFLGGLLLFGLLLPWALYIVNLVFSILGFVRVNSGGAYRYPLNFRFIKG